MSLSVAPAGDGTATPGRSDDALAAHGVTAKRVLVVAWAIVLGLLLRHREVLSSDTLSNYVHVWWVAERFWHGHGLPFHMPVLASGRALAFPYGFIPWMFAVLLWPLLGEWSVTLTLGVGFVGMVLATFYAFPELKRGWWAAAVLVNPGLPEGLLLGQLPFMWAAAFLLLAIGQWRRGQRRKAILLAALAQVTHAPILVPITAALVLLRWRYPEGDDRRRLVRAWALATVPAIPAGLLVILSPVTSQSSLLWSIWVEIETLALRALVFAVPIALLALYRRGLPARAPVLALTAMIIGQLVTLPVSGMGVGWGAINRRPDTTVEDVARSSVFVPGATYRVLTFGDSKYGQYAVVRAGGRLDSEFFPESLHRKSFPGEGAYAHFLIKRQVDFVIVEHRYRKFRTNEEQLLASMATVGRCRNGVAVQVEQRREQVDVYTVDRNCPEDPSAGA